MQSLQCTAINRLLVRGGIPPLQQAQAKHTFLCAEEMVIEDGWTDVFEI